MQNKLNKIKLLFEKSNNQDVLLEIIEEIEQLSHSDYQENVDWNQLKQLYNTSIKTIPSLCNKIKNMIENNMKKTNPKTDNSALILQEIKSMRNEFHGEIKLLRTEFQDEMKLLRTEVKAEMESMRSEFHGEIKLLKTEFHGEIKLIRSEIWDLKNDFNSKFDVLNLEIKEIKDDITRGFKNLKNHFGIDFLKRKN